MTSAYRKFKRTNVAEMRNLEPDEQHWTDLLSKGISVSEPDRLLGPELFRAGMVTRNPLNHDDKWYVNRVYITENFQEEATQ